MPRICRAPPPAGSSASSHLEAARTCGRCSRAYRTRLADDHLRPQQPSNGARWSRGVIVAWANWLQIVTAVSENSQKCAGTPSSAAYIGVPM